MHLLDHRVHSTRARVWHTHIYTAAAAAGASTEYPRSVSGTGDSPGTHDNALSRPNLGGRGAPGHVAARHRTSRGEHQRGSCPRDALLFSIVLPGVALSSIQAGDVPTLRREKREESASLRGLGSAAQCRDGRSQRASAQGRTRPDLLDSPATRVQAVVGDAAAWAVEFREVHDADRDDDDGDWMRRVETGWEVTQTSCAELGAVGVGC